MSLCVTVFSASFKSAISNSSITCLVAKCEMPPASEEPQGVRPAGWGGWRHAIGIVADAWTTRSVESAVPRTLRRAWSAVSGDPFLVSSALTLAVAQRLYRTICEDCKSYIESDIVWERLDEEGITESKLTKLGITISGNREYAVGKGCPKCRGTGYFGRRALFEMFNVTQEAKNLLSSKDFTESGLKRLATEQGMSTLLQAGRRAVEQGMTTVEEIIRVCGEE